MRFRLFVLLLAQLIALATGLDSVLPTRVRSQHAAPLSADDGSETVVGSGSVSDFTRVGSVLYAHSAGSCYIPPKLTRSAAAPSDVVETVARTSLIGSSPDRQIYTKDLRATNNCQPSVFSQVVADADNLYWVDASGLVKLSKSASPGDTPQLLSAAFSDQKPYEIAIGFGYIYLSRDSYTSCGPLVCSTRPVLMAKVDTSSGVSTKLNCTLFDGCTYGIKLTLDPLGRYLYFIDPAGGHNTLQRMDLSAPATVQTLASDVSAYAPEGWVRPCPLDDCPITDYVYIAAKNGASGAKILRYNTNDGSTTPFYTSSWPRNAEISDIVADKLNLFFYEVRADLDSGPFANFTGWLFRASKSSPADLANLHQASVSVVTPNAPLGLINDGARLYWLESGNVLALSNQAAALPQSPMRVTGIEVTQSVQTPSNTVPLIRDKRTFVRVYVKSDDPSRDVPGVTASLRATWTGGSGGGEAGPLVPVNLTAITVKRNPSRSQLNDAFLFELPWEWLSGDNLRLTAELNPRRNPEQSDGYANNRLTVGPFHLNPSPRLEVRLFEFSYKMGDTIFSPADSERFANISWIRRAYPVDESEGNLLAKGGGLHWIWSTVRDDALADKVRYPSWPCEDKDTTLASDQDSNKPDCQNLRASAYATSQIAAMRDELLNNGDTNSTSYYGLIPSGEELRGTPVMTVTYFPRGQDGAKNAAGPAGSDYIGYYAAHEIGHSVGLDHPATAAATQECGVKGADATPNYPHGHIGADDDATNAQGFLNTPGYSSAPYDNSNLALGSQTFDMMAYCKPEWISDQNYVRIYKNLSGTTPTLAAAQTTRQSGNWLVLYGSIFPGSNTATMDYLRHKVGSVSVPPREPGAYAIRLLDGSGHTLQDYPFTPAGNADAAALSFGQAVTFVPGTRLVRIVRLSDQRTLAEAAISATPPTVRAVALAGAASPVTGTALLSWAGSDPDGDTLRYDVLYSRDGGATFQPLIMHTAATRESINTHDLGGGSAIFHVVASDGANSASADSAPFTMENKPPVPQISLPSSSIHVHYGQVVNFSGAATDAQDGLLGDSHLVWTFQSQPLATGPLLTQQQLPPGVDVISLTATNSAGLAATTSVTVNVDDDIEPAASALGVSPGAITWQIPSDSTAPQTQTLSVANAGTSSAGWQVSSDAAWLTVAKTSGADGETLVATGDPAGLHNGETWLGHLRFTTTSAGVTRTTQVAVSLIKGNVFQNPYTGPVPAESPRLLFLPLLRR